MLHAFYFVSLLFLLFYLFIFICFLPHPPASSVVSFARGVAICCCCCCCCCSCCCSSRVSLVAFIYSNVCLGFSLDCAFASSSSSLGCLYTAYAACSPGGCMHAFTIHACTMHACTIHACMHYTCMHALYMDACTIHGCMHYACTIHACMHSSEGLVLVCLLGSPSGDRRHPTSFLSAQYEALCSEYNSFVLSPFVFAVVCLCSYSSLLMLLLLLLLLCC